MSGAGAIRRVLIIGLDGGTWSVLDRFVDAGAMPRLGSMLRSGHRASLLSTIPPTTPVAWASFSTGMDPGRHGVFGFLAPQRDPGSYSPPPVRRDAVQAPSLWRRLSDAGLSSVVLSVPLTYPPEPLNGAMVTGMFTPTSAPDSTCPAELRAELSSLGIMPKFQLDFARRRASGRGEDHLARALADNAEIYLEDISDLTNRQLTASLHLIRRPWDLFVTVFIATDRLQHVLWDEVEASPGDGLLGRRIADFYSSIDKAIGELVDAAGPEAAVIVMSDHGFGRCAGNYSVGRWLVDEGYARHSPSRAYGALRHALDALGLKRAASRAMGSGRIEGAVRRSFIPLDWSRTVAYFQPGTYGIRVNLKGREPRGIVAPGDDYDRLRREIRDCALEMTDAATGERVLSAARLREEVYDGPHLGWAPDVLLEPAPGPGYHLVLGDLSSPRRVAASPKTRGSHRREGILLVSGTGVQPGRSSSPAAISDIAPTVLWLLGQRGADEMDGDVLRYCFDRDFEPTGPRATSAGLTSRDIDAPRNTDSTEDDEISDRLRGLGYVD